MKIIVGITGGSGAIYSVALLQAMKQLGIEAHLVMSHMGEKVLEHECGFTREEISPYTSRIYDNKNLFAPIASGTFKTDGMIIVPCSMKTLAAVAAGYSDGLLTRSADVTLKEGRKLVIVPRETPLSQIHLENMLKLSRMGVTIMPASPGFYNHPQSIADIVGSMTGKMLDAFNIEHNISGRWGEDI
ncbi:MAG: UbiX family flavin prenyltransferase [Bacillota bacterium]